ncbi:MAG: arsenate reductase/protein-tyrosine-phosphatase family protein [Candidatus Krumholzibacteriia bacterium]
MAKSLQVLFLCAGNTCRSPLVEGLARRRYGGSGTRFASAGLHAAVGQPASEGSLLMAAELGIDLAGHRSRPLTAELLAGADWVIAMTRGQVAQVRFRFPDYAGRLGLLGLPGVDLAAVPDAADGEEVADPYGGALADYHRMTDQVVRLLEGWRALFDAADGPRPDTGGDA